MSHIKLSFLVLLLINFTLAQVSKAQQREPRPPDFFRPEMEQIALKFIETHHPSRADELKRIKLNQPERYIKMITDIFRRAEQIKIFQKEDPERYELEIRQVSLDEKTFTIARAYQNAKDEKEKQSLRQQLESAVSEHFDIREQIKESELKRMENDLQRLKERLNQRKANKSEIVKQRINQLMTIGSGLEWE